MKKKKPNEHPKKTVFQTFADFIALDFDDPLAKYEVMLSERSLLIVRCNFDK